jgi:hypothetical protein
MIVVKQEKILLLGQIAMPVPHQEIHLATLVRFWHNYSRTHPAQNFKHNLR